MKIFKIGWTLSLSMLSVQCYADPVQDQGQDQALASHYPSYANFQKNGDDLLGKTKRS